MCGMFTYMAYARMGPSNFSIALLLLIYYANKAAHSSM